MSERIQSLSVSSQTGQLVTPTLFNDSKVDHSTIAQASPCSVRHAEDALLQIQGLDVLFPLKQGSGLGQQQSHTHAVSDLNLTLQRGRTLALVGESGCGKSTTALALMRLLPKYAKVSGRVMFDGQDLLRLSDTEMRHLRGNTLSMIFQEPMTSLNPVFTIGAQIIESFRQHQGLSKMAARQRTLELLDLVRIPEPHKRIDDYPHQLSGGQRQRVMIAMAVSCQPRLLIADEPTTALDVIVQTQILELLDELRRELSMAVLMITHDLGVVSEWADDVIVMYGGKPVEAGVVSSILQAPQHPYTRGLLDASLHGSGKIHYTQGALPEINVTTQTETNLAGAVTTHQIFEVHTPAFVQNKPVQALSLPLLAVENLHCEYLQGHNVIKAVRGVSFEIKTSETLGLVGESGCGKSTLSKALLRLLKPSSGSIVLNGNDITTLSERDLKPYRPQMQMVFQDPYASLNPRHTVYETLETVLRVHGVKDRQERYRRVMSILDDVGLLGSAAYRYPSEFSGGQRQRIGIARALIMKPALVICDEPVSALDVSIQAQILNLLSDLKHEYNLAYLFISHDLAVVRYMADNMMVMQNGQIVEAGTPEKIWQAPEQPYTQTLLASVPESAILN